MANLITIVSLKRSGHHAILEWLLAQFKDSGQSIFHFNDEPAKFFTESAIAWMPTTVTPPDSNDKRTICINFEDKFLRQIEFKTECAFQCYNCIVLRDPFNCMASRCAKNMWPRIDIWKTYAREFLGITNCIPTPKFCISYNHWLENKEYREKVATQFGVKFTDSGFGLRPALADWGSSFDSRKMPISEMKFTERWRRYAHNGEYIKLWQDPEIWDLSQKIFGIIPGTDVLRGAS